MLPIAFCLTLDLAFNIRRRGLADAAAAPITPAGRQPG